MEECWPNFFIVGAPKAGTTSLFAYLEQVPEIYMPRIKEPHYFSHIAIPENSFLKPMRDKKKYLKLFSGVKDEIAVGEASPTYLRDPKAAKLIHEVSPDAKIIILLRDPVERIYSAYFSQKRIRDVNNSFHEIVLNYKQENYPESVKRDPIIHAEFYSKQIKQYLDVFGPKQVKIIIFEEFIKDPKKIVRDVIEFLGIKNSLHEFQPEQFNVFGEPRGPFARSLFKNITIKRISKNVFSPSVRRVVTEKFLIKKTEKPKMDEEDRLLLQKLFKNDVNEVKHILKRTLPWKNFQEEN